MKIIFAPKFSIHISGKTSALTFDTATHKLSFGNDVHIQFPMIANNVDTTPPADTKPIIDLRYPTQTDLVSTPTSAAPSTKTNAPRGTRKKMKASETTSSSVIPVNATTELDDGIDMPQDLSEFSTNKGPRSRSKSSSDYQRVQSPAVTLLQTSLTHDEIQKILSACETPKTRKEIVDLFLVLDDKDFQSENTKKVFFSQLCQKYIWDLVTLKLLSPSEIHSNPLTTKRAKDQKFSLTKHGKETLSFANQLILNATK